MAQAGCNLCRPGVLDLIEKKVEMYIRSAKKPRKHMNTTKDLVCSPNPFRTLRQQLKLQLLKLLQGKACSSYVDLKVCVEGHVNDGEFKKSFVNHMDLKDRPFGMRLGGFLLWYIGVLGVFRSAIRCFLWMFVFFASSVLLILMLLPSRSMTLEGFLLRL